MRSPIDFGRVPVKQSRTFAAIAHSPKLPRAADFSNQRAAEQPLEIKRCVRSKRPRFFYPGPKSPGRVQAAELPARKNVDVIHVRIPAEERGPFRVDHPSDFGSWMGLSDRRDRGQRMDDVAEGARFDDEDGTNFRFQISDFRLVHGAICNLKSTICNHSST